MTDTEEAWHDENAMDWLTFGLVSFWPMLYLAEPTGKTRWALFAVFTLLSTAALYGSYQAVSHNDD